MLIFGNEAPVGLLRLLGVRLIVHFFAMIFWQELHLELQGPLRSLLSHFFKINLLLRLLRNAHFFMRLLENTKFIQLTLWSLSNRQLNFFLKLIHKGIDLARLVTP